MLLIHSANASGSGWSDRPRRRPPLGTLVLLIGGAVPLVGEGVLADPPVREASRGVVISMKMDQQLLRTQAPGAAEAAPPRVASNANHDATTASASTSSLLAGSLEKASGAESIDRARKTVAECQSRYRSIHDYTCTFVKRERIEGRLTEPHIMAMKVRTHPNSLYVKFQQPNRGREAIYIHGRNSGRIVAHDVGLGKLLAGNLHLDPRGTMAMEENRHPITEAGIGPLIDTVARHWAAELTPGESRVKLNPSARLGNRSCTVIESVHPQRSSAYLFHMVKLYIDHEHNLPIRFEAYDWPRHPGAAPELVEEYSYLDLKINVGLREHDFDPANAQYSFGRF